MSARDLGHREVAGWLHDSSLWPVCQPCGLADSAWSDWDRLQHERRRAAAAARRRAARGAWGAFRAAFRERLRCRADLAGAGAFLALVLFVFHRVWSAVAGDQGTVGGLTVAQLLTYLLVAELVVMGPGTVHQVLGEDVRSGAFVVSLLRPLSLARWELARAAGGTCARVLVLAPAGLAAVAALTGLPRLDPRGLAVGGLVLLPAALAVELCVRVAIGLSALWVEEAAPFYWIWQKLAFVMGGLFLPLDFYPPWLRILADALPFRALVYGPARTVIAWDAHEAAASAILLLAWGAGVALALTAIEALGRRRVQANGG
jgi:ABC-2 type transport system permease protein